MDKPRAVALAKPSRDDDHRSKDCSRADLIGYSGAEKAYIEKSTANKRQLVLFNGEVMRRSAKCSIINSEKEGKRCPWGDKCPSCDIQTSKLWITLQKAKEHFVRTGDDAGIDLDDKDVVDYWRKIAPNLSEEMFQANGANERAVCRTCYDFAMKRFAKRVGATTIFVPHI